MLVLGFRMASAKRSALAAEKISSELQSIEDFIVVTFLQGKKYCRTVKIFPASPYMATKVY